MAIVIVHANEDIRRLKAEGFKVIKQDAKGIHMEGELSPHTPKLVTLRKPAGWKAMGW